MNPTSSLDIDALKLTENENISHTPIINVEANMQLVRDAESREEAMRIKLMATEDLLQQQAAELISMNTQVESAVIHGAQQVEDRVVTLTQELTLLQTELNLITEKLSQVSVERDVALQKCSTDSAIVTGLQHQLHELQQLRVDKEQQRHQEEEQQLQEMIDKKDVVHAKALSQLTQDLDLALVRLAEEKRIREALQDSQTRQRADLMENYITIDAHMMAINELQNQLNEKEAMSRLAEENRLRELDLQDSRLPSLPPPPYG